MQGIARCRVFVLVFTDHANDSEHVGRELANAFSLGLAVIPFRIEAVNPRENLAYFLETVQWFDATTPPLQKHHLLLTEHVQRLLSIDGNFVTGNDRCPARTKSRPNIFCASDAVGHCIWFAGPSGSDCGGLAFLLCT
jgi:hypothetical protein